MSRLFSLLLYNLLRPLGLAVMLPGAIRKLRARGGKWQDMGERFGFWSEAKRAALARLGSGRDRLWIHAVSVGEVGIATKLITQLLKARPSLGVVITTTTPTAHAMALEWAAKVRGSTTPVVLFSPIDLPFVGESFLELIRPSQLILVEAELWPNLVSKARRDGIRVSMVNARLSARSEARFHLLLAIIRPIFSMLDQVLTQEPEDSARFQKLGVRPEGIHHTGSIKFDPEGAEADPLQVTAFRTILRQLGITETQPVLLLASTHPGEEVLLAQVALNLRQSHPDLALLIVPRHVERGPEILKELQALGITALLRSEVAEHLAMPSTGLQTLLINTTGELRAWQSLASMVVIGKSFLAKGGQNPAEAVMASKPVLFGPQMQNFEALVALLHQENGAIQVPDTAALEVALKQLLEDPARRQSLGEAGHRALAAHQGAAQATVSLILHD